MRPAGDMSNNTDDLITCSRREWEAAHAENARLRSVLRRHEGRRQALIGGEFMCLECLATAPTTTGVRHLPACVFAPLDDTPMTNGEVWERRHNLLVELAQAAMGYVQHHPECAFMDIAVGECDCGLNAWGEAVKQLTGFYDDDGEAICDVTVTEVYMAEMIEARDDEIERLTAERDRLREALEALYRCAFSGDEVRRLLAVADDRNRKMTKTLGHRCDRVTQVMKLAAAALDAQPAEDTDQEAS